MIARRKLCFAAAAALLCASIGFQMGCSHRPTAPARGNASFQILTSQRRSPTNAVAALDLGQPREIITDAQPHLPLAMPVYPPAALRARHNGALISVHVVVDSTGKVRDVTPSLVGFSSAGAFATEFWAAVEAAVRQWKFDPAEAQLTEPVSLGEGRVFRKIVRREPVEATFDIAFTFTSTGEVVSGR